MNWLIKTLAGAVIAGVGLKIGTDLYETAKKTFQGKASGDPTVEEDKKEEASDDEAFEGALETEVVELEQEQEARP